MDTFKKHDQLHDLSLETEKRFHRMLDACLDGEPTAEATKAFFEAERAENGWRAELDGLFTLSSAA
jgi:hypothetical protein